MADYDPRVRMTGTGYATGGQVGARGDASIDEGLRAYMLRVYNTMGLGLAVSGIVALLVNVLATTTDPTQAAAQLPNGILLTSLGATLYGSPLRWVVMLAPLAFIFFGFRPQTMSLSGLTTSFYAFAALMGLSMSSILLVYTASSVVQVFFVTAAAFGALSLWGYTTKRDLTGWGSFLFIGLIGLILVSIVNIFLGSSALQFLIGAAGVLIFAGLTAYDTQKIKEMYYVEAGHEAIGKMAVMGALSLYLDFVNMFQFLLMFLGNRE